MPMAYEVIVIYFKKMIKIDKFLLVILVYL